MNYLERRDEVEEYEEDLEITSPNQDLQDIIAWANSGDSPPVTPTPPPAPPAPPEPPPPEMSLDDIIAWANSDSEVVEPEPEPEPEPESESKPEQTLADIIAWANSDDTGAIDAIETQDKPQPALADVTITQTRPVRNFNPGNIMATSLEHAKSFYPEDPDMVVGWDKLEDGKGYIVFRDKAAGLHALNKQIVIDQFNPQGALQVQMRKENREATLKDFISKFVGLEFDPKGTKNAYKNIPDSLGVSLDTPLKELDTDALTRAVIFSEGGDNSINFYFQSESEEEEEVQSLSAMPPIGETPTVASIQRAKAEEDAGFLDSLSESFEGAADTIGHWTDLVTDNFSHGVETEELNGDVAMLLLEADVGGGFDGKSRQELDQLLARSRKLQDAPRPEAQGYFEETLAAVGASLPSMLWGLGQGAAGAGIAGGGAAVAAAVTGPGAAIAGGAAATVGLVTGSMQYWSRQGYGEFFVNMVENGMDPELARSYAKGGAVVYGAVGAAGTVGKALLATPAGTAVRKTVLNIANKATKEAVSKVIAKGGATKLAAGSVTAVGSEVAEEVVQTTADVISFNLAREAHEADERGDIPKRDLFKEANEVFIASIGPSAIMSGGFYGVGKVSGGVRGIVRDKVRERTSEVTPVLEIVSDEDRIALGLTKEVDGEAVAMTDQELIDGFHEQGREEKRIVARGEKIAEDADLTAEERASALVQVQVELQNNRQKWVGLTEFINDRAEAEWGNLESSAQGESPIVTDLTGEKGAELDALLEEGTVRKLFASSTREDLKAEAERSLVGYQRTTRKLGDTYGLKVGQEPETIRTYEVSRKGFQKSFGQADFSATTREGRKVEVHTHEDRTEAVIQGKKDGERDEVISDGDWEEVVRRLQYDYGMRFASDDYKIINDRNEEVAPKDHIADPTTDAKPVIGVDISPVEFIDTIRDRLWAGGTFEADPTDTDKLAAREELDKAFADGDISEGLYKHAQRSESDIRTANERKKMEELYVNALDRDYIENRRADHLKQRGLTEGGLPEIVMDPAGDVARSQEASHARHAERQLQQRLSYTDPATGASSVTLTDPNPDWRLAPSPSQWDTAREDVGVLDSDVPVAEVPKTTRETIDPIPKTPRGITDYHGHQVSDANDIANIAQASRDKNVEWSNIIAVDTATGQVVATRKWGLKEAGATQSPLRGDQPEINARSRSYLTQWARRVRGKSQGDIEITFVHNHPSGVSTPSNNDVEVSREFNEFIDGIDGASSANSLVIDSNEYAVIDKEGGIQIRSLDGGDAELYSVDSFKGESSQEEINRALTREREDRTASDPLLGYHTKTNKQWDDLLFHGDRIRSAEDLAHIAKHSRDGEGIGTVVFLDATLGVRGISDINLSMPDDELRERVKRMSAEVGGRQAYVTFNEEGQGSEERIRQINDAKIFNGVMTPKGLYSPEVEQVAEDAPSDVAAEEMIDPAAIAPTTFDVTNIVPDLVNEDGTLIPLYHGTTREDEFEFIKVPRGTFVASDPEIAKIFSGPQVGGRVIPIYANIKKVWKVTDDLKSEHYNSKNYTERQKIEARFIDEALRSGADAVDWGKGRYQIIDPEIIEVALTPGKTSAYQEVFTGLATIPKTISIKRAVQKVGEEELNISPKKFLEFIPDEAVRAEIQSSFRHPPGKDITPTPKALLSLVSNGDIDAGARVLDLGAGIRANAAQTLIDNGMSDVVATDMDEAIDVGRVLQERGVEGFDSAALHEYGENLEDGEFDVIMLQNVLNVQRTGSRLSGLLDNVDRLIHAGGKIVANFPTNPRNKLKDPVSGKMVDGFWGDIGSANKQTEHLFSELMSRGYDIEVQRGATMVPYEDGDLAPQSPVFTATKAPVSEAQETIIELDPLPSQFDTHYRDPVAFVRAGEQSQQASEIAGSSWGDIDDITDEEWLEIGELVKTAGKDPIEVADAYRRWLEKEGGAADKLTRILHRVPTLKIDSKAKTGYTIVRDEDGNLTGEKTSEGGYSWERITDDPDVRADFLNEIFPGGTATLVFKNDPRSGDLANLIDHKAVSRSMAPYHEPVVGKIKPDPGAMVEIARGILEGDKVQSILSDAGGNVEIANIIPDRDGVSLITQDNLSEEQENALGAALALSLGRSDITAITPVGMGEHNALQISIPAEIYSNEIEETIASAGLVPKRRGGTVTAMLSSTERWVGRSDQWRQKLEDLNELTGGNIGYEYVRERKIEAGTIGDLIKGLRGSKDRASSFERVADDIIIPYAKAIATQGFRFRYNYFADEYRLTPAEENYLKDALYPKDGEAISAAKIVEAIDARDRGDDTELPIIMSRKTALKGAAIGVADVSWALQNFVGERGQIASDDYSDEALEIIAGAMADEISQHINSSESTGKKSARGWYDNAVGKSMDIYRTFLPMLSEHKSDPNPETVLFHTILGITSQGNPVIPNSKMTVRSFKKILGKDYDIAVGLPTEGLNILDHLSRDAEDAGSYAGLGGSFGKQYEQIEGNFLKLQHLIDNFEKHGDGKTPPLVQIYNLLSEKRSVTDWKIIVGTNKTKKDGPPKDTPSNYQDLFGHDGTGKTGDFTDAFKGVPAEIRAGEEFEVTGWFLFGPKIGSFINNLHGDYETLTADLWFTRTWNRYLGNMFIHVPEAEAPQYIALKRAIEAEYYGYDKIDKNDPKTIRKYEKGVAKAFENGEADFELLVGDYILDTGGPWYTIDQFLNDPEALLDYAQKVESEYRMPSVGSIGGYSQKSSVRRAAKNWIEGREFLGAAPKSSMQKGMQQRTVERAAEILKDKYGIETQTGGKMDVADIQAALWFFEKELFQGLRTGKSGMAAPADYADAARLAGMSLNPEKYGGRTANQLVPLYAKVADAKDKKEREGLIKDGLIHYGADEDFEFNETEFDQLIGDMIDIDEKEDAKRAKEDSATPDEAAESITDLPGAMGDGGFRTWEQVNEDLEKEILNREGPTPGPGEKRRRFGESMRREGRGRISDEAANYRVVSNAQTRDVVRRRLEKIGADRYESEILTSDQSSAERTAASIVIAEYRRQEAVKLKNEATEAETEVERNELLKKAEAAHEKHVGMIDVSSTRLTEEGQAIQAASMISMLDPESVNVWAQKYVKRMVESGEGKKDAAISVEDGQRLEELARRAQAAALVEGNLQGMLDIITKAIRGSVLDAKDLAQVKEYRQQIDDVLRSDVDEQGKETKPKWFDIFSKSLAKAADAAPESEALRDAKQMLSMGTTWKAYEDAKRAELGEGVDRRGLRRKYEAAHSEYTQRQKESRIDFATMRRLDNAFSIIEEAGGDASGDIITTIVDAISEMKTRSGIERIDMANEISKTMKAITDPVSIGEKLSTAQTIMQLLNPKTQVRNIVGNELFYRIERLNKYIATPVDWGFSKVTGKDREVTYAKGGRNVGFIKWSKFFMEGAKAAYKGDTPAGLSTGLDLPQRKVFQGRFWGTLEGAMSGLLRGFDYASYKRAYEETIGEQAEMAWLNYGKEEAGGKNKQAWMDAWALSANDNVQNIADQYGKYVTFQDDSLLARGAQNVKRALNLDRELIGGRLDFLNYKGRFGLGDFILKYAKTPANLINRGLAYTPAGVLRGAIVLTQMSQEIKKNKWNKNQYASYKREGGLALSRGLIGTGMSALTWKLVEEGILSGDEDEDWWIAQTTRDVSGVGKYQVNIDALLRYAESFGDSSKAKRRDGDMLVSYDWALPLSIAMGATADATIAANRAEGESGLEIAIEGAKGSLNIISEQPLLQGINTLKDVFDKRRGASAFARIFTAVPASFMPQMLNQIGTVYQTKGTPNESKITTNNELDIAGFRVRGVFGTVLSRMLYKTPMIEDSLPKAYKAFGLSVPRKRYAEGYADLWHVFLNPAFVNEYKVDRDFEFMLEVMDKTGSRSSMPEVIGTKILADLEGGGSGKKIRHVVTAEERSAMQKIAAEYVTREMRAYNSSKYTDRRGYYEEQNINRYWDRQNRNISKIVNNSIDHARDWLFEHRTNRTVTGRNKHAEQRLRYAAASKRD